MEGYAGGRFQTQAEVKRFLESFPEYPKGRNGRVHNQRAYNLLTRVIYSGYVEHSDWGVSLRRGQHEGLITYETFKKIQERIKDRAKVPARKNLSLDFPLRGAVICGECSTPLTSCWSTGRSKKYVYYHLLHGQFEEFLKQLTPSHKLFPAACRAFKLHWEHLLKHQDSRDQSLHNEIIKIDHEIEKILDKIVVSDSETVMKALEQRVWKQEQRKVELRDKIADSTKRAGNFDEVSRTALTFISNPYKVRASGPFGNKRAVLDGVD